MVRGWAVSRLHLSPAEFGLMRPGVYWEAIMAWQADKEADRRHIAEVVRAVGVRLFNVQLSEKDQLKDARDFLPLPWDEEDTAPGEVRRLENLSMEDRAKEAQDLLKRLKITQ